MPARRRRNHVHRGRRPEASREGTRGTVGRRACRAHLWGFGRFGSGAGSAPMHPSQRSGGVDAPERGIIAVAELARRCPSMLHPQVIHPIRPSASVAGAGPAMVTNNRVAAREGHRFHEVSIRITAVGADGRCAGEDPRANRSMMSMRPPQQGQGCVRHGGAVAPAGSAVTVAQGAHAHQAARGLASGWWPVRHGRRGHNAGCDGSRAGAREAGSGG